MGRASADRVWLLPLEAHEEITVSFYFSKMPSKNARLQQWLNYRVRVVLQVGFHIVLHAEGFLEDFLSVPLSF